MNAAPPRRPAARLADLLLEMAAVWAPLALARPAAIERAPDRPTRIDPNRVPR